MKRLLALAILLPLALVAGAQDQPLRPVLIDDGNVIIHPNPHVLAEANNLVMTTDALYSFITNSALVTAATNAVGEIAALNLAITNIPASSITSGDIAADRLTNALLPNSFDATIVFTVGGGEDKAEHTVVIEDGQITSWTITP